MCQFSFTRAFATPLAFFAVTAAACGSSNETGQDAATLGGAGIVASDSSAAGGQSAGETGSGGMVGVGGTTGSAGACIGSSLLSSLGRDSVLVGASMEDATAALAPFDGRYLYLSGGLFDGATPCVSCASGCTSGGTSCSNAVGCGWWGCWQYDQVAPGQYVVDAIATDEKRPGRARPPTASDVHLLRRIAGVRSGRGNHAGRGAERRDLSLALPCRLAIHLAESGHPRCPAAHRAGFLGLRRTAKPGSVRHSRQGDDRESDRLRELRK